MRIDQSEIEHHPAVKQWLQDEFEATGQTRLMYRPVIRSLHNVIEQLEVKQLLLDGMPGAGKSIVLGALAHWARQKGWVVRKPPFASCSGSGRINSGCVAGGMLAQGCVVRWDAVSLGLPGQDRKQNFVLIGHERITGKLESALGILWVSELYMWPCRCSMWPTPRC